MYKSPWGGICTTCTSWACSICKRKRLQSSEISRRAQFKILIVSSVYFRNVVSIHKEHECSHRWWTDACSHWSRRWQSCEYLLRLWNGLVGRRTGSGIFLSAAATNNYQMHGWIYKVLLNHQMCATQVLDAGTKVIMPGLVDTHTHVDEPGRTDWEGFYTATRAAAAGGFTSIIDMPLQCSPPTTTVDNFNLKLQAAQGNCHVDVGFWGGAIGNPVRTIPWFLLRSGSCLYEFIFLLQQSDMKELLGMGVCGFKCFLISTGFDEFPHLNEQSLDEALETLEGTGSVLQVLPF